MARDNSLWNRIMYGGSRQPAPVDVDPEKYSTFPSEKAPTTNTNTREKNRKLATRYRCILAILCIWSVTLFYLAGIQIRALTNTALPEPRRFANYQGLLETGFYPESLSAQEVLSVAFPFKPEKKYGKLVYESVLIDNVFDSWGKPLVHKFVPPKDVEFNRVVLKLKTSVDGVQYDRLAHLYVNGAEIWRTSTIEPGARSVFSEFKKDVSSYTTLFQKPCDVLFQLDNIVSGGLTGKFHIELQAHFYNTDSLVLEEIEAQTEHSANENYRFFDIRKPADLVYPLYSKKDNASPPLKYLPSDRYSVKLPQVSKNTTRAKLTVFLSGNGNEEFWYSNVLDKLADRFEKDGNVFFGHGPLRYLNVFVDGQKIASQTPQPFLFTGAYSPALWSPVVPNNAFDLPSVDLDVSGLLPLLWTSGDHELKLSVANGLDEFQGSSSGIGHDWIISANLLTYESSDVEDAHGKIIHMGNATKGNAFGFSPPYTKTMQQISTGKLLGELTSEIYLKLKDGKSLNTTFSLHTLGGISNVQDYSSLGDVAHFVHTGRSLKSILITDNLNEGALIHQTNISLTYPLVINLSQKKTSEGTDLDFKIVNGRTMKLEINNEPVFAEHVVQNGTSDFFLRNSGNYGFGSLTTRYRAQVSDKFKYKRRVESENGQITSDNEAYEELEKEDWDKMYKEISQASQLHGPKKHGCGGSRMGSHSQSEGDKGRGAHMEHKGSRKHRTSNGHKSKHHKSSHHGVKHHEQKHGAHMNDANVKKIGCHGKSRGKTHDSSVFGDVSRFFKKAISYFQGHV